MELRESLLSKLRQQISDQEAELERFQFDNNDHATVAEILALPVESRLAKTSELLSQIDEERWKLTERIAIMNELDEQIRTLQKKCDQRQSTLQTRSQQQLELSTAASETKTQAESQEAVLRERNQGRYEVEQLLAAFWQAMPKARPEFEADPEAFWLQLNEKFSLILELQTQLATARQKLVNLESQEPQIDDELQQAAAELEQRTAEFKKAQDKLDDLHRQLQELLGERTVEEFRQEIEERDKSARKKLDNAKNERIEAEKSLTTATTHHDEMQKKLTSAIRAECTARSNLNTWLAGFSPQLSSDEAMIDLQQLLNHDGSWIQREREALDLFAGNVSTAKGHVESCQQRLDELIRQLPMIGRKPREY